MSISVEKFLEITGDYDVQLIAGEGGLGKSIEWFRFVHNLEDAEKVCSNEIVFLGSPSSSTETEWRMLADIIAERDGSAIVCTIEFYADSIVDSCDQYDLPLIVFDPKIDLTNITKSLCVQLIESERATGQMFTAMKNAISFPELVDSYVPTFVQYGFRQHDEFAVAIIKLQSFSMMPVAELQWLVHQIEQKLMDAGDKSFILTMGHIFVLVFSHYTEKEIHDVLLDITVLLRMKSYSFYSGVSLNLPGVESISKAYKQAKHVILLSEKKNWQNTLRSYSELGIYQILLAVEDPETKRNFLDATIGVLIQSDESHGTDYIPFLKVYLENDCNITKTAEKQFLHRNTVVYKVKKISELLDSDITDFEVCVTLYIAMILTSVPQVGDEK